MEVTWKQIDINGNGYVDGNEERDGRTLGAKNVWNDMTFDDYKNNITRDDKVQNLVNKYMDSGDIPYTISIVDFSIDRSDEHKYIVRLDRQLTTLKQEYENLHQEYSQKYSFIDIAKHYLSKIKICDKNDEYINDKNKLDELNKKISDKENELIYTLKEYRSADIGQR